MSYRAVVYENLLRELPGLKAALEAFDFQLIQILNGKEILKAVADYRPQIAILDVFIPQVSGLELCRQIKEDSHLPTKVILVTSNTSETLASRAEQYSCDLYAMKNEAEAKIVELLPNCRFEMEPSKPLPT